MRRVVVLALAAGLVSLAGCGARPSDPPPAPQAPSAGSAAPLDAPDVDAWLDGLVPAALERADIAGAAVAVVHDGKVLTTRGYGHADTGTSATPARRVDPQDTLFRPGSVSKLFTATAVMQLVESGELDLDADVDRYLDFDLPRRFDEPITVRHLLTHTAGFEDLVTGLIALDDPEVDLRAALATDPPEQLYRPGTTPAYSNYGNALAGYVVQRVSGTRFEDYVQQNVLDRTGMTSSTFTQPLPKRLAGRLSKGYATASTPAAPFETVGVAPAGALSASTTDMARFMLAQLGDLPADQSLLQPQTLAQMHAPALDEKALGALAEGPRMTLGFFDESRDGQHILGHGGDTQYFHSHLQIYPEQDTGIYVTMNSSGADGADTLRLREAVTGGFTDRYFPGGDESSATVDRSTSRDHAAAAAGTYRPSRTMDSTFLRAVSLTGQTQVSARPGERLLFEPAPNRVEPALFEEVRPWVWREVGGHQVISMRVDDGSVTAIGADSAFALVPLEAGRTAGVAVPVVLVSLAVLVVGTVAWPVGAMVRRRRGLPRPATARLPRVLQNVAVLSAVVAMVGWVAAVVAVMGFVEVPAAGLRALQVLQWVGVAGVVPALVHLVDGFRHRVGAFGLVGSALTLVALVGVAWFAWQLNLLSPSVSY